MVRVVKLISFFIATLQIACSDPTPVPLVFERVDERTLMVVGEFDHAAVKALLVKLNTVPAIETLQITSGGGDVDATIALAEVLFERGFRLEMSAYCLSSCFNYLVPAAREIFIHDGAILGFHGSAATSVPWLLRPLFKQTLAREAGVPASRRSATKYLSRATTTDRRIYPSE